MNVVVVCGIIITKVMPKVSMNYYNKERERERVTGCCM